MPTGRKIFRSNVVKAKNGSTFTPSVNRNKKIGEHEQESMAMLCNEKKYSHDEIDTCDSDVIIAMFGESGLISASPDDNHKFENSRAAELEGLKERNVFKVVDESTVPHGTRIYGSRWVDVLKSSDGKSIEKSRLVAQNFRDKGAADIPTKSPTVS